MNTITRNGKFQKKTLEVKKIEKLKINKNLEAIEHNKKEKHKKIDMLKKNIEISKK